MDSFLWGNLSELNLAITRRFMPEGGRLLDLGCGDGSSSIGLPGVLIDFVRPNGLTLSEGQTFIECDLRDFATTERFDVITLYGVLTYLDELDSAKLLHKCYGWLKPGGVLLVKHQCGKDADVFVDGYSQELEANYVGSYYTSAKYLKMARLAGFNAVASDPYPPDRNNRANTQYKLFICRRNAVDGYKNWILNDDSDWQAMQRERRGSVGCVHAKLELLAIIKSHLDAHDIPFHLMFGTLLGAVRDGEFIEWDTDVDIAILDRYQNRMIDSLSDCPLKLIRVGDFYCTMRHKLDYIDIYTYVDEGEKYAYCGGISRFFDEEKNVFDDWSEIEFKGMRFRTVENPKASLARWYGADWRTPNQKFARTQE